MSSALEEALLLKFNPDRLFFQQRLPVPQGIAQLIRIAIDPGSAGINPAQRQNLDDEQLQAAAGAYLKGVCLFPGSQGLRVLGLNDAGDNKLILEHRRLLLKWLHPDRNPENRHLAERVNRAWALQKTGQIESAAALPMHEFAPAEILIVAKPRRTRFPLFLAGIAVLAVGLWALSRIPDSTDYLGTGAPVAKSLPKPKVDMVLPDLADSRWGAQAPRSAPAVAGAAIDALQVSSPAAPAAKPVPAAMPTAKDMALAEPKAELARSAPSVLKPERKTPVPTPVQPIKASASRQSPTVPATEAVIKESAASAAAPELNAAQSQAALQRFLQLYRAGNLDAFMAQFNSGARTNRGGRDAIREDYARLFLQSKRRELEFSQAQWQPVPGGMRFTADYRSKVLYHGDLLAERSSGGIEMLFSPDAGQVRIASIMVSGQ